MLIMRRMNLPLISFQISFEFRQRSKQIAFFVKLSTVGDDYWSVCKCMCTLRSKMRYQ